MNEREDIRAALGFTYEEAAGLSLLDEVAKQGEKAFLVGKMVMQRRALMILEPDAAERIAALEPFHIQKREKWLHLAKIR